LKSIWLYVISPKLTHPNRLGWPPQNNPKLACRRISDDERKKHALVEKLMIDKQKGTVEEIELNLEELEDVIAPGGV